MAPLLTRRKVLAAKIETTPGVAESLLAANAGFNVFDATANPNISFIERQGQYSFSPLKGQLGAYGGQVSFAVELAGSGSVGSPAPAWAETFLPACGLGQDGEAFRVSSLPPGADGSPTHTLTIGLYEDGRRKVLRGCMGNAVFNFKSGEICRVEFTFTGIWDPVTDVAMLQPTYPTVSPLRFVSADLDLDTDWSPKISELSFDLGNEVILREDAEDPSGYASALIVARRVTGAMDPEAALVATRDTFGDWLSLEEIDWSLILGGGSANGNVVEFGGSRMQFTNVQGENRNGIATDKISFQLNREDSVNDAEFELTFS